MSLKDIDLGAALRRLADKRIEDAIKEGKFDNLPGAGKPLDLDPMPADEDARATWWALRIMRQHDYTPDEIRWRKLIDGLKQRLQDLTNEQHLEPLVSQINHLVHKLNTLGTNAMKSGIAPLDLEHERQKLRLRLQR